MILFQIYISNIIVAQLWSVIFIKGGSRFDMGSPVCGPPTRGGSTMKKYVVLIEMKKYVVLIRQILD
ncbi:MAG: hypothetical protein AYK18_14300 [Theionarchaea archaeon DG-70]|nr:MAG: hypothetical protein AYK18_14300 [Theionarchaea archaeon DG-70]